MDNPYGISPHVDLYKQLQGVQQSIDKLPPVLFDCMNTVIERKGVTAGNITKDLLGSTIESLLKRAGLAHAAISEVPQPVLDEGSTIAHFYGGKFRMLPEMRRLNSPRCIWGVAALVIRRQVKRLPITETYWNT
ncbi:LOW QUALITY PROTEIN: hypothetical protein PHMEG_00028778 [Phytophthora megakarya]|uniref:Uncharacterized protein n=1 Tax=Phytophthora megakarya TaxID=4795 RepID=A0A225V5B2_9STRA|nr:LOW QUALITY PROTEIN: hypothetical protein PHMEG_00028778 [Phytophthora megakarya]